MFQLTHREMWRRYRNRERIPIGFLCSFAADNHEVWYGDFEMMRISYDGLWALYFDRQWAEPGKSMELVTVCFIEQLEKYFKILGIPTEVLKPFRSLAYQVEPKTTRNNMSHALYSHKTSPFCKRNDGFYRYCNSNLVDRLPHTVNKFYLNDLIEAYDIKEEILSKTKTHNLK